MALTNAQLVRREAGDPGLPTRDAASGDATATVFYLSAPPLIADSQSVSVGATVKTETVDYTLNDLTGRLAFVSPPALGTDNIVAEYLSVEVPDADIEEACRQVGLTATASAGVGDLAILEAAAMVCDWRAALHSADIDFSTDGQDFKGSTSASEWARRAEALRNRIGRSGSLVAAPVTRIDGYSARGEYSSSDYDTSAANPRREFYGDEDDLP